MTLISLAKAAAILTLATATGMAADAATQPGVNPQQLTPNAYTDFVNFFQQHITGGSLGIIITLLAIYSRFKKTFGPALKSFSLYRDEHDIMWEDYNIRSGGSWRIPRGRVHSVRALHETGKDEHHADGSGRL